MAAATPLSYLYAQVTQGSADAFVQGSLTTGLSGLGGIAYQVREISFEWPPLLGVNSSTYEVEIGLKTAAAMSTLYDKTILYRAKRNVSLVTSGLIWAEDIHRDLFSADEGFYIVTDPIYIRLDTNATSVANTLSLRIGYQQVKLSDIDRLSLLSAALTT